MRIGSTRKNPRGKIVCQRCKRKLVSQDSKDKSLCGPCARNLGYSRHFKSNQHSGMVKQ